MPEKLSVFEQAVREYADAVDEHLFLTGPGEVVTGARLKLDELFASRGVENGRVHYGSPCKDCGAVRSE